MILSFSCKKKESNIIQNQETFLGQDDLTEKDSITISVRLAPKEITGFNIKDKYYQNYFLEFNNSGLKDTIIIKRILRIHKKEVISYSGGYINNGKIVRYQHHYLILKAPINLNFKYIKGDLVLENSDNVVIVDDLYNDYNQIDSKIFNKKGKSSKANLKSELESIFNKNTKLDSKEAYNALNYIHYLANLQGIYPKDSRIESYLINAKDPIASSPYSGLLYTFAKNRIRSFDFKKLNENKYSKRYLKRISLGIFNFLRYEGNKGDKQYSDAINWLKTSDLYKNNIKFINKEINPLDNRAFKEKLGKLSLLDTSYKETSFSKVINKNPSNYYLIDFWATWCKPCIEGVKIMKKMSIPKNVSIISLSLDKKKEKGKWKTMTKELTQNISYLVKEEDIENKEFLKFIELESVPRYILIDKNMNLIDESFLHPSEPQFLPKLKDIKYAKYW